MPNFLRETTVKIKTGMSVCRPSGTLSKPADVYDLTTRALPVTCYKSEGAVLAVDAVVEWIFGE